MTITIDETSHDQRGEAEAGGRRRSVRRIARLSGFYVPLVLAAVMTVLFLPELLATLVTGWTAEGAAELGVHRLHVMGIAAVVATFLVGLFAQAYKPRRRVAAMWGALLTIAIVSAGTVYYGVGRPEEVLPFLLVTGVAFVFHPAGRALFKRGETYSPLLFALVAIAVIPVLAFVATQMSLTTDLTDPHAVDGHYVMMIGLVLAPLAYGIVAAMGFAGWRLAAWLAAFPMAFYGVMSVAFPMQVGSTGLVWGVGAILWAIAFIAVAEYSRFGSSQYVRRPSRQSGIATE